MLVSRMKPYCMAFAQLPEGGRLPTLLVKRATLAYDVTGEGPNIVQLHGLTSSRARDASLGLDLSTAAVEHRVIRYDARGHGESTGDTDPRSYSWWHLARDLLALLDAESPGAPVHGVGQSMGSGTLLHAALARPEGFASLVLGIPPTAWQSRIAQRAFYRTNADTVERHGIEPLLRADRISARPPAAVDHCVLPPTVSTDLLPTVFRGAALADLPSAAELATIDIRTLILAWVDDPAHPLSTAYWLHEVLPDSQLVVAKTPEDVLAWSHLVAEHLLPKGETL